MLNIVIIDMTVCYIYCLSWSILYMIKIKQSMQTLSGFTVLLLKHVLFQKLFVRSLGMRMV